MFKLVLGKVGKNLSEDFKPMQFQLGRLSGESVNDTIVVLHIPLRRYCDYHAATTFFPTFCLLTIACLTLWIDPAHFQATIALSLTTMLVMQTLQENISDDLPKTSYIKLVDMWLIAGMIVPFLVFMVLVLVETLPKEQDHRVFKMPARPEHNIEITTKHRKLQWTKEKVHSWFKYFIPISTILFALGFMITTLHIISSQSDDLF